MAKKIQLQDANGNVLHPLTLGECVTMSNGENLDTLMSKSQMFTPTITQDKSMFKVGTGVDVDYSANVKDGAYESLVFKGKSLVNLWKKHDTHNQRNFTLYEDGFMETVPNVLYFDHIQKANIGMIKPNTKYLLIVEVVKNTLPVPISFQSDNRTYFYGNSGTMFGAGETGVVKKIITSISDLSTTRDDLRWGAYIQFAQNNVSESERGVVKIRQMLIEYQQGMENWDIPYFDGIGYAKMPILRTTGKNWLYYGETLGTPSITSYSLSNNELTITNDGTKSYQQINFVYKDLLNYKGKTLTLSGYATPNKADLKPCFQVVFQDSSGKTYYYGSTNSANTTKRMSRTFTIPYDISSDYTPRISFIVHNANESGYSGTAVFSEIMLEESPSPTTYENHKTNILHTSEEIVLREVNGVQDTYNALTGEYVQRIGEIVLDGSENEWEDWSETSFVLRGNYFSDAVEHTATTAPRLKCNNMVAGEGETPRTVRYYRSPTVLWTMVGKNNGETLDQFKTWLSQNPTTIQYILAEPVTTIVKPSTMTPFAYQNGHVILESGFEGQSLLPEIEYSVVTGRAGQVTQNTKVLRKQEQQIIGLEELLLTQVVQMEYERTLLQFDYELQMMMLG